MQTGLPCLQTSAQAPFYSFLSSKRLFTQILAPEAIRRYHSSLNGPGIKALCFTRARGWEGVGVLEKDYFYHCYAYHIHGHYQTSRIASFYHKKETTFVGFPNRIRFSGACCQFFNCFELPDPYGCTQHSSYYLTHTIPILSSSRLIPGHRESNIFILLEKKYVPLYLSNNRLARYNSLPTVSFMVY